MQQGAASDGRATREHVVRDSTAHAAAEDRLDVGVVAESIPGNLDVLRGMDRQAIRPAVQDRVRAVTGKIIVGNNHADTDAVFKCRVAAHIANTERVIAIMLPLMRTPPAIARAFGDAQRLADAPGSLSRIP